MSTARQARYRLRAADAGRRQIATWITREAAEHLDTLLGTGAKLTDLVSAAILTYRPSVARNTPARVSALLETLPRTLKPSLETAHGSATRCGRLVLGWRREGASWAECARRLDAEHALPWTWCLRSLPITRMLTNSWLPTQTLPKRTCRRVLPMPRILLPARKCLPKPPKGMCPDA